MAGSLAALGLSGSARADRTLHAAQVHGPAPLEAPTPRDQAAALVDRLVHTAPHRMDEAGLQSARLAQAPWSGGYWPLRLGGLAYRTLDPEFPRDAGISAIERHVERTLQTHPLEQRSPAEKYDLLVGDPDFTLTRRMLALARSQAIGDRIEPWYGFCTGWANAAMMMPRPRRAVTALSADGKTRIEFLPDDLKALAALLWNGGRFAFRVAGRSCTEEPIATDPESGRALAPECRDTNPATLHLAVVNQLGAAGRSLLIDSDPGNQVWNQPVSSYKISYFHPVSGAEGSYGRSRIRRSEHFDDPFAPFRANGTQSILGVKLTLTYVHETEPSDRRVDAPEHDESRTPVYEYELELDSLGRIIGGEWRNPLHPDLLWVASPGAFPMTQGDRRLSETKETPDWNIGESLPMEWREAALESARQTLPLGRITLRLFDLANTEK